MAADLNQVALVGRLTRDIEIRSTASGKMVTSFSLAVNGRNDDDVSFIECVAWGKLCEILNKYAHKGKQIAVSGRLKQSKYQNKEGENRYKTEVIIENMQLLGGKPAESGDTYDGVDTPAPDEGSQEPAPIRHAKAAEQLGASDISDPIDLSEIPF